MCIASPKNSEVIFPYLTGEDLLTNPGGQPGRYVIDFHPKDQVDARLYNLPFQRIKKLVLSDREQEAELEQKRNASLAIGAKGKKGNRHHDAFLRRWWLLSYARADLITKLESMTRYIVCSRVTKRPVFEFVSNSIHPSDALSVFPLEDDYSFGILQSSMHWAWFKARCSTLTARFRYTSESVFDSFPWPQSPDSKDIATVAKTGVELRALRQKLAASHDLSLRAMYAALDDPGKHPLKDAQAALDAAVRAAYGMGAKKDPLAFLLDLNQKCASEEAKDEPITGPGLPPGVSAKGLVTKDAVQAPKL
jgi:hypothetical protein